MKSHTQNRRKGLSLAVAALLFTPLLTVVAVPETAMAAIDLPDEPEFDEERIALAGRYLLTLIQGGLGAIVMVVAGMVALFSAAIGAYRPAMAMVFVAVGAFILGSLVELFFGEEFCGVGQECSVHAPVQTEFKIS